MEEVEEEIEVTEPKEEKKDKLRTDHNKAKPLLKNEKQIDDLLYF